MTHDIESIDFNQWVHENNPSPESKYSKGFWDWVENVRRLSSMLKSKPWRKLPSDAKDAVISVVGSIRYETPPPTETITMPVVCIENDNFRAYVAYWFSVAPFLPSYLIAVDRYRINEDDMYMYDTLLSYETFQNEFEIPHRSNEDHTLKFYEKAKDRIVCDQLAQQNMPFSLDPHYALYGDPDEKMAYSFDELWTAINEKDKALFSKKPLLYCVWSYEALYSSLSLIHRISSPSK